MIEILLVLGIISMLFATFFYIWNTMDIFRKSRDSKRINDLQVLDTALKTILTTETNVSLGQENIIYTSLPDSSSTCGSYNLVQVYNPYSYHCSATPTDVNGNGWMPINFTIGKILTISVLPIDPLNNKDYFYAYQVSNGRYKLTARFESKNNISKMANDGGFEPTLYEVGSNLFISSPHSGLVGYWNFDEATGTIAYDYSGYGNNGTLVNDPTWTTGKINKALSFDGVDDYVEVMDSTSLDLSNSSYSLIAYIKPITAGSRREIIGKGVRYSNGYGINFANSGTLINFGLHGGGNFNSASSLILNNWYFIAGVYNKTISPKGVIYINGIIDATNANYPYALSASGKPVFIGRVELSGGSFGEYFAGTIDEVRIYNRALSEEEIKALYEATK